MNDGKKFDVLVNDRFNTDPRTGVEMMSQQYVTVYADAGLKEVISKVAGVVSITDFESTEYIVKLDLRFDRNFVKSEIEAAVLCNELTEGEE